MKQKYMKKGTWCLSLLFVLGACSLDYEPVGEYSELTVGGTTEEEGAVFKDRAEVLSQYNSLYTTLKDAQEYWYNDVLLLAESHSDNAYAGTTGAEVIPFEDNSLNASASTLERDWNNLMKVVAAANKLIIGIDDVTDSSLTSTERKQWKAEAKILRSMAFFDMARMWGDFPVVTTLAGDITAENIEEVFPAYFPEQNTAEEAYTQIVQDLTEALVDAPDNNTGDKTKLSKSVARALLAKVYAEKPLQDYKKVIEYADALQRDGFDLATDYELLFGYNEDTKDCLARNTVEGILEVQYFTGSGNWATWMFGRKLDNWDESFTWAKWITPSRDLIRLYDSEGDDVRKNQSIVYYACTWSNYYPADNYPFMYKLRSSVNSIIKLRYADILLLKAEALIMTDDLAGGAAIINKVRNRVGLGPLPSSVTGSKNSMIDALLKERRMELAFEGQRWFDLCRLGKVEEVMNAVFTKDSGRLPQKALFTEYSYRMPIPQNILDMNSNLVQNPGY